MKAVLFVDDHEVLARLSCEILESQGYRAVCAYNAHDALEKFQQEKFDIVVTDFKMDGMNGLELAQRVHATNPRSRHQYVIGYGKSIRQRGQRRPAKEAMFPACSKRSRAIWEKRDPPARRVGAKALGIPLSVIPVPQSGFDLSC